MKENSLIEKISPLPIQKIAFGVRYDPQFIVGDTIGFVMDTILRGRGSPFNPEMFPVHQSINNHHQLLINPSTADRIVINETDAILILEQKTTNLVKVEEIATAYNDFILRVLRDTSKIRYINRYGLLLHFDECSGYLNRPPVDRYVGNEFSSVRDLSMRFSHRLQTPDGHIRKGVKDYRNIIYTILQDETEKVFISLDYQEYFAPSLDGEDLKQKTFTNFVNQGIHYHLNTFNDWIKKLFRLNKAA